MDINSIYSLSELLKYGESKDIISFESLVKYDNNLYNYNCIDDYIDILLSSSVNIKLTDKEVAKYKYKPKILSYDIYGDPEYFYIILIINNMTSVKDFDLENKKIKLIKSDTLSEILSTIKNKENKDYM